jgi:outer membrane protein TolC
LSYLNAGTELNQAKLDLEIKKSRLRIFLGFNDKVNVELNIPDSIPKMELYFGDVFDLALKNNPDMIAYDRQLREAARDVAKARAERGLNLNLFTSYGLTQNSSELSGAYLDPRDQQRVTLGVQVPILDWGLGKGKLQMAKSTQELIRISIEQERTDFQQNVFLQVMQFNMQGDQFTIAQKANQIAQLRYDMAKQRFLIGRTSVLELNVALTDKDQAKRRYIDALKNYWLNYYNLRSVTLYDFVNKTDLGTEYDKLLD